MKVSSFFVASANAPAMIDNRHLTIFFKRFRGRRIDRAIEEITRNIGTAFFSKCAN